MIAKAPSTSVILGALLFVLLAISAPAHSTEPAADTANGEAFQMLPCWPAGADYYDPTTHLGHCQGAATWLGSWTGEATFDVVGTLDIITGDASGTIEQDFNGYHMRNGQTDVAHAPRGQMHFSGTFQVVGATGEETVQTTITNGTGDFAGATGNATFYGLAPISIGPAEGTYSASWNHPNYPLTDTVPNGPHMAVIRNAQWLVRYPMTDGIAQDSFVYGAAGDRPVYGDWNNDGLQSPAVFRDGTWFLTDDLSGGAARPSFDYGMAGDRPVAGYWGFNVDKDETVGVFRGGDWFERDSNSTGTASRPSFLFGTAEDLPVVGDWDGDGIDSPGVFRPRTGEWFLTDSNATGSCPAVSPSPTGCHYFHLGGGPIDFQSVPIAGNWDDVIGDGVGLVRGGTWLRTDNTVTDGIATYPSFNYGSAGDDFAAWSTGPKR